MSSSERTSHEVTSGLDDRLGELADVALDPLALEGERELRAALGEPLGDRPRDRALVRDAEHEAALSLERHRPDSTTLSYCRRGCASRSSQEPRRGSAPRSAGRFARTAGTSSGSRAATAPDADEHEACDVGDRAAVEAAAARVLERHPRIDLLVNNAGIAGR